MKDFPKKLQELRLAKNLTQEELANIIDVTRQAISKWERGEGMPDLYNVSQLAKAFDVTVDKLIDDEMILETKNKKTSKTFDKITSYLLDLFYKTKDLTNAEKTIKLRKTLLKLGTIGSILGVILVITGFVLITSIFPSYSFSLSIFTIVPGIILFSISIFIIYIGFGILVAGAATKHLDTRLVCPNCNERINKDDLICTNCGYTLKNTTENNSF